MSAAAPTKVSVFRPPFRPVETPSFESGKPVCPQARRQDRAPRAFSNLTAPGLQSLQAHGPAAIDSEYTPLRKTILAQSLCVNVWCCVNVAIKLFISQWVGRLSNSATRSWRNVPNKNCTVYGGCVTTSSIMSASSSWVNNSLISKLVLSNICAITFLAGLAGTWCALYVNRKQFPVEFKYASRGTVKLQGKRSDGGFSWAHRSTDMISKPARCSTDDTLRPQ